MVFKCIYRCSIAYFFISIYLYYNVYDIVFYTCTCKFLVEKERKTWSQAVQRDLPRPREVNTAILKGAPHRDQKFRDLYEVSVVYNVHVQCSYYVILSSV